MRKAITVFLVGLLVFAPARTAGQTVSYQPNVLVAVRLQPDLESPVVAWLQTKAYAVVGRNATAEWLRVQWGNNAQQGWVLTMLGNTNLDVLSSLPELSPLVSPWRGALGVSALSTTVIPATIKAGSQLRIAPEKNAALLGQTTQAQPVLATARSPDSAWIQTQFGWVLMAHTTAQGSADSLPFLGWRIPNTLIPKLSHTHKKIYRNSVASGRRLNSFSVVGDSSMAAWFRPLDYRRLDEGRFSYALTLPLRKVASRFPDGFYRDFIAAQVGFNSGSVLNAELANPQYCAANENPLECDLRVTQASVVFVAIGTNDQYAWQSFEGNYRRIITVIQTHGALPVLLTKADENERGYATEGYINTTIRKLAAEHQLPLIDLWQLTRPLPGWGMGDDHYHLNDLGLDMRLIVMLKTLEQLR
jgi:hypothetical protein